jgi:DNA sulfur modification protein DndD
MKLTEIKLVNFRQFKGEQSFPLETDGNKNVTLLFGANGAGKTTFLNAFTWAFYGKLSDDLEQKQRIVTDYVWTEAKFGDELTVSVEVSFEHDGTFFRAKRSAEARKSSDEQGPTASSLELWTSSGGQSKLVDAPQQKIETILPPRLSRFFFFNGERIEDLVNQKAYAEVKQDIKTLLNLEQVEKALLHLPKVDRKLAAEFKKHGGDQAGKIQEDIETSQDAALASREKRTELQDGLAELNEELQGVLDLLRKHAEAGPLQKQRDETEERLNASIQSNKTLVSERNHLVATRGYMAFAGEMSLKAQSIAAELHERGALPAPLKREFVETLIDDGRCICGTDLVAGTAAMRSVEEWRSRAGLQSVEAAWQKLSGQVGQIADEREQLRERLKKLASDIEKGRAQADSLNGRLTELEVQVKNLPSEEIGRLEKKREDLQTLIADTNRKVGGLDEAIKLSDAEIDRLRTQLKSAEVADVLASTARRRMEAVTAVQKALQQILDIRSNDMRDRLDEKLKEVFSRITVKPYYPALTADFELGLYQDQADGTRLPVPKSTGENQILSLSFVAAVSQLAREVASQRVGEESSPDSGTYPIVMDAAFGSLDINYQRDVSRALADMAPQMIVLVSKSQGQGQVLSELLPHVNHMGVFVAHSSNDVKESETIELAGRDHPFINTRSEIDWTELVEVGK